MTVVALQPHAEIDDSIVRTLRAWLAMAERGEFRAVALAAVKAAGGTCHVFSKSENVAALIGSIVLLQNDLTSDVNAVGWTAPVDGGA